VSDEDKIESAGIRVDVLDLRGDDGQDGVIAADGRIVRWVLLGVRIPAGLAIGGFTFSPESGAFSWSQNVGPEAALSAPSEPVPDGPRVWAMPTIPADVGRLTDADGETWYRCGPRHWQPARTHRDYGETELIARRGPLTEVVEEATP
jgi:hypothetical protein